MNSFNLNQNNWQPISVNELNEHRDEWQIVDIRDQNSYSQGHIPGAFNINNINLHSYIDEHDFDKPLVVVCYVGNSSKGAADIFCKAGFNKVYSLNGGMSFWRVQYPELVEMGMGG